MNSFPAFPQMNQLSRLVEGLGLHGRVKVEATVSSRGETYPIYSIVLGNPSPDVPVFGLIGGVHGLEKIGTEIVLAYLDHLLERLAWDQSLRWQLERVRLILMPLVNPIGMRRGIRSNGNSVDLMRNSPSVADEGATFLVGGHRISRLMSWHMGDPGKMEVESQALCDFIQRECFHAPHSVIMDVHSGFGLKDQIWFPYARSRKPFPSLPEVSALKHLLDRVFRHHIYRMEPQALIYTTHGDLWDHLYDEYSKQASHIERPFVPLTLELGSWSWVRKNPLQILTRQGAFNPMKPHRQKRALRRHLPLFDFLMRSVISPQPWKLGNVPAREAFLAKGLEEWYGAPPAAELRPTTE